MAHRSLGHRAPLLWLVLPYAMGLVAGRWLGGVAIIPCLLAAVFSGGIALLIAGLLYNFKEYHATEEMQK